MQKGGNGLPINPYEEAAPEGAPQRALLLLVEWVDSARPLVEWCYLEDAPDLEIVRCTSVGWLVGENDSVLMLAPNLGDVGTSSMQGCGFMRIPRACVTRTALLKEAA